MEHTKIKKGVQIPFKIGEPVPIKSVWFRVKEVKDSELVLEAVGLTSKFVKKHFKKALEEAKANAARAAVKEKETDNA